MFWWVIAFSCFECNNFIVFVSNRLKVTSLTMNNEYEFRVAAVNAAGTSPYSIPSLSVIMRDPIGKMTILHIIYLHKFVYVVYLSTHTKINPLYMVKFKMQIS